VTKNLRKENISLMKQIENEESYFRRFQNFSINRMVPPSVQEKDSLIYWRVRILFAILFTAVILGTFVLAAAIALAIKERLWGLAIIDATAYLIAIGMLFSRRPGYEIRAALILLMSYAVGLAVIVFVGPFSGGPAWLFAFAVLVAVLLGSKAAIAAISLNAITLTIIGWLITTGLFGQGFPFFNTFEAMVAAGASYILLNAVAAISVAVLVKGLIYAHEKEKTLTTNLEQEQNQLIEAQKSLEIEVEDRKQAEEALREREEKYRNILDNIQESYFEMNLAGDLTFFNDSLIRITGYSRDELMGMNNREYTSEETAKMMYNIFNQVYTTGEPAEINDYEIFIKSGEARILELSTLLMKDQDDRPVGFRGIARDVTERLDAVKERKQLEAQFHQAQKMEAVGTLAGGIAHDFNNLLQGIQGRASLMLMDTDSSHPNTEHINEIVAYVKSAADLTKQLLGFARGGKYEVKTTDLNELIKNQNQMFGRTRKEISIREKHEENLWAVEVDQGQIEQALMNLYINAFEAMPGGGDLYVQTENIIIDENYIKPYMVEPGKYIKISVTDTGVGMDKATQQRIFEPFFTTREMGRGTGLGLASAYGIVKNHDGFINVYSEKGKGTTFNIYFPASKKKIVKDKKIHEELLRGTETVLLVDDEDMIIDVGQDVLELLGYGVLPAKGGEEAVEVYEKNQDKIDMVILDMIMPDMGGGQTYDRLKEINPDIKVLLSSGYSINGQATEILERGCDGFIQKPFNIMDLSQKIREIFDKK
jgi:PAS domain S-box-containing protein